MFTHRGGSRMAAGTGVKQIKDFQGKSLLVPHALSIQNMLVHRFLGTKGLVPDIASTPNAVCTEAVPSALMEEMAARDKTCDIAGFICEEPFGTAALGRGVARPLLATTDLWPDHPGSAFVVRRDLVDSRPDELAQLVSHFFKCAAVLDRCLEQGPIENRQVLEAAAVFLKQPETLVAQSLSLSGICFSPDLLVPDPELVGIIARYMGDTMEILSGPADNDNFIDQRFALNGIKEARC